MISGPEIAVIAIVALLLFGPDKIPQVLKTLKKAVGIYAEARDQVQEVVTTHVISQEELDLLKDPLGIKGSAGAAAGSKGALLTPERKSLYSQTMPVPEAHVTTPVEAPLADSLATQTTAAPVVTPNTHQSETVSPAPAPAPETQAPVAPGVPTQATSTLETATTPAAPTSAAASIWASLEQAPPAQSKDDA